MEIVLGSAGLIVAIGLWLFPPEPLRRLLRIQNTGVSRAAEQPSSTAMLISPETTRSQQPRVPSSAALLEPYFPAARRLVGVVPANGFHLVIVSGLSSAGKDVLVAETFRRIGPNVEMLKKYTTRHGRPGEPSYVVPVTRTQFEKAERAGKVIFPYHKRDFEYGFDTDDLLSATKHGICKLAVFTELTRVPAITAALRANGILATAIFVSTDRPYLVRRSYHRNFETTEVEKRLVSIEQDLNTIGIRGKPLSSEYHMVENNESEPFDAAKLRLETLVRRAMDGDLPWPP